MSTGQEYFLTIDAGSSCCKVGIGDSNGKIISIVKSKWDYFYSEELKPYGIEFDKENIWKNISSSIKEAINKSAVDPRKITSIAVTSQRHACIFVDSYGEIVYAGPNRDARGIEVDMSNYINSDDLYKITGQNPPFLYVPARYLWFKENDEDSFDKIDKILPLNSWIMYKLTNNFVVDITSAFATQLIDLKGLTWSEKILKQTLISKDQLPHIIPFGSPLPILEQVCKDLGLNTNVIATLSGADTHSAIIGSGANLPGDVVIVAGSTMPIVQLITIPIVDRNNKLWSGCSVEKNTWLVEANAGSTGVIKDWFVKTFSIVDDPTNSNIHENFDNLAQSATLGSDEILMDLDIPIFDHKLMTNINLSTISFPSIIYSPDQNLSINSFYRALLENIAFAIRGNIDEIERVTNQPINDVFIVGGLAKSDALKKILASVLNTKVIFSDSEATILGGFIACTIALGKHSITQYLSSSIKTNSVIYYPEKEDTITYDSYYKKWLTNYKAKRNEVQILEV